MQFYRASADPTAANVYCATQAEAHAIVKTMPQDSCPGGDERRIELVEIATDKETILDILNHENFHCELMRTWKLTPRGAMVECPNGE